MTMHSALRDPLEPVYRDNPALKRRLRAVQGQYYRMRTAAYEHFPSSSSRIPNTSI